MKKLILILMLSFLSNITFAESGDKIAFWGNFFKSKPKKEEVKRKTEMKEQRTVIFQENKSFIPVVEGEPIPSEIVLTYQDEDSQIRSLSIPVVALQRGDRRPAEIAAVEKAITNEKVKEKVVAMMKYYVKIFDRHLKDIANDSEKIYLLGNQYFINGRYEKAKDIFSKNIDTPENLFGSAVTNRFLGYDQTAIDYYSEVIDMRPNLAEPYLGRGISYRNLKKYDQALTDFLIYKSMKDTEEAYSALGNIYLLRGNYSEARRILTNGKNMYPQSKLINDLLVKAYGK